MEDRPWKTGHGRQAMEDSSGSGDRDMRQRAFIGMYGSYSLQGESNILGRLGETVGGRDDSVTSRIEGISYLEGVDLGSGDHSYCM